MNTPAPSGGAAHPKSPSKDTYSSPIVGTSRSKGRGHKYQGDFIGGREGRDPVPRPGAGAAAPQGCMRHLGVWFGAGGPQGCSRASLHHPAGRIQPLGLGFLKDAPGRWGCSWRTPAPLGGWGPRSLCLRDKQCPCTHGRWDAPMGARRHPWDMGCTRGSQDVPVRARVHPWSWDALIELGCTYGSRDTPMGAGMYLLEPGCTHRAGMHLWGLGCTHGIQDAIAHSVCLAPPP